MALAVKSFRNMRSAALTPVARRLRDIMIKRQQLRQQQQQQQNSLQLPVAEAAAPAADWTEVSIACPPPGTRHSKARFLIPPGQLLRDTLGAEVLLLLGALLAFLGSAVTLLATYGRFGNPESRPTVMGLGPPLVGIGFLFCLCGSSSAGRRDCETPAAGGCWPLAECTPPTARHTTARLRPPPYSSTVAERRCRRRPPTMRRASVRRGPLRELDCPPGDLTSVLCRQLVTSWGGQTYGMDSAYSAVWWPSKKC